MPTTSTVNNKYTRICSLTVHTTKGCSGLFVIFLTGPPSKSLNRKRKTLYSLFHVKSTTPIAKLFVCRRFIQLCTYIKCSVIPSVPFIPTLFMSIVNVQCLIEEQTKYAMLVGHLEDLESSITFKM